MRRFIHSVYILLFLLTAAIKLSAQDTPVVYRVILLGDGGEVNAARDAVIAHAAQNILPGKTTTVYLGDNIYPKGIGLPGSKEEQATYNILAGQYKSFRQQGVPVYFVPGNHDWDRMGPKGLEKIKYFDDYLNSLNDSLLQLVPHQGCPDPYEIKLTDNFIIIAFDSEWWLYPFNKDNPAADCACKTKDDIVSRLEELAYKNRDKVILLAAHHPFQSYGHHGGYYSWKDHLFPFTAINKDLYIPLPVVGSLYPFLRTFFTNPEDLNHPLYKEMISKVNSAFTEMPNLTHVAGHEHTLQLIKNSQMQVVSGSASKEVYARNGKDALYSVSKNGYVTADLLSDNSLRLTYYTYENNVMGKTFTYVRPFVQVTEKEDSSYAAIKGDSAIVRIHPVFDDVSGAHRWLFGENFRKEYSMPIKLPVIRISDVKGGLTPDKRGGGHQTRSLRLQDKDGKEWVLRSVEKYPDVILPEALRQTVARDIVYDNMSASYPFGPLLVTILADAVKVPHSNPVIGLVAPDKKLGIFGKTFANTVCLLEEREPLGNSDNTFKMMDKMDDDNDNRLDSVAFFRARMLDLFLADWDRHEDQWRWVNRGKKGKDKDYIAVPRDRDQAFYRNEGFFPEAASRKWIAGYLQGFHGEVKDVETAFFFGRNLNSRFLNQVGYDRWMKLTNEFVASLTDDVFEKALQQLPQEAYKLRHDELLTKMKQRRDNLPAAMEHYYRFYSKRIDIKLSDKNEKVSITNNGRNLDVNIHKINKNGEIKDLLYTRNLDPKVTKEVRIYTGKGDDSITIRNDASPVLIRVISKGGNKVYDVQNDKRTVQVYAKDNGKASFLNDKGVRKHLSSDSANTAYVPVNLYNVLAPLVDVGYNMDDGVLLGLGAKYTQQGFRKEPYASMQQLTVAHSFLTKAYRVKYRGEWLKAVGNADITLQGTIYAPNNTINFFGTGNETEYIKTGDYKRYYRTRFSAYSVAPALRWRSDKKSSISVGASFMYYHYDSSDNIGRVINNTALIKSYDSTTIAKSKAHLGLTFEYTSDRRNSSILPSWGTYLNVRVLGYTGLNKYSESFVRILPEVALYKSLTPSSSVVIGERLGGGITAGKAAFYQNVFLGGQGNLMGYRQYRYAGQHMLYNNLELRVRLGSFANYIIPGEVGLLGF